MNLIWGLLLVLVIVTMVGHGIWTAVAFMLRGMSSKAPRRHSGPTHCPRCDNRLASGTCPVCSWPLVDLSPTRQQTAIQALRNQLDRYAQLGLLDTATAEALDDQLLTTIQGGRVATAPRPRPQPAAAPPPVSTPREHAPAAAMPTEHDPMLDIVFDLQEPARLAPDPAAPENLQPYTPSPVEPPLTPAAQNGNATVSDRVREFTQRRASLASEPQPRAAKPPRRAWTDLLAAFMEEKNIRWGELVGGLLIVGCSIALVISFWARIAERPLLKFVVFNGVTAALFGLGLYSARRWSLKTTSVGVLMTATLLVPLNFLAIAAFTEGATAGMFTILGELISLGLFAALLYASGPIITPQATLPLIAGTLAPSVLMLLGRRFVLPDSPSLAGEGFGWLMAGAYLCVNLWGSRAVFAAASPATERDESPVIFRLLGVTSFATLLALSLLVYRMGELGPTFARLSPLICGLGLTPIALGLSVWQRNTAASQVSFRIAGLSIALLGMLLLVAGVVLAWPEPRLLCYTSALAGGTLIAVALSYRIVQIWPAAILCLTQTYLLIWHLLAGRISWRVGPANDTLQAMLSGATGQALVPLVAVVAAAAWALRGRLVEDARQFLYSACGLAALSIALVTWYGFGRAGDPLHATWIYALYAAAAFIVADRQRNLAALCGGALLLGAALAQGIVYALATRFPLSLPWPTALTVHAGLLAAMAAVFARLTGDWRRDVFAPALRSGAQALSAIVAVLLFYAMGMGMSAAPLALGWSLLAVVWLILALDRPAAVSFTLFQSALAVGVWWTVAMALEERPWFQTSPHPWLDPWTLIAEGLALGALSLVGLGVRTLVTDKSMQLVQAPRLYYAGRWQFDNVLLRALAVVAAAVAIYAALPGVAHELSPYDPAATLTVNDFRWADIPQEHARTWGMGLWLGMLSLGLLAELCVHQLRRNVLWLLGLAALVCPLAASGWQAEVATASALRWFLSGYLLLASILVWNRHHFAALVGRLRRAGDAPVTEDEGPLLAAAVFTFSLMPLVAMGAYVSSTALWRYPPHADLLSWLAPFGVTFVAAAGFALLLHWAAEPRRQAPGNPTLGKAVTSHLSTLLVVLGIAPLVSLFLLMITLALRHSPILGPDASSWFARVGSAASYAVPILLTAITLVGYAVRERSARYAFAGGLVLNLAVTAAFLMHAAASGITYDLTLWIRLTHINAICSALYALGWTGLVRLGSWFWKAHETDTEPAPTRGHAQELLITQICIPVALNLLMLGPAWLGITLQPARALQLRELGAPLAWGSFALAVAAIIARRLPRWPWLTAGELSSTALAGAVALAILAAGHTLDPWTAIRVLLGAPLVVIAGLAVYSLLRSNVYRSPELRRHLSRVAVLVSLAGSILATRTISGDPQAPWWSTGTFAALAVGITWFAGWAWRRGLLHYAALLILLGTLGWWADRGYALMGSSSMFLAGFGQWTIIALAAPVLIWSLLENFRFAPAGEAATGGRMPRMQFLGTQMAVVGFALLLALSLTADLAGNAGGISVSLQWMAAASVVVAAASLLWDRATSAALAWLYLAGLLLCGTLVDALDLDQHWMVLIGTITLAAYALLTSLLWSGRDKLQYLARALRMPHAEQTVQSPDHWLININLLLALLVVILTFSIELTYAERTLRFLAAKSVVAVAVAVGLLARGKRRSQLQTVALLLGTLGAVALAWSPLNAGDEGILLNRAVAAAAALAAMAVLYGLGLGKLLPSGSEWLSAAQRLVPKLMVAAGAAIMFVLTWEVYLYATAGEVKIGALAGATVVITLVGLSAAALAAAILPGRDPLQLSERGRQAYVYAAEILLALTFMHVRLTMPWLFEGFFRQYWPVLVMLLAFVGAGVGEWFRRRQLTVLGDPLEKTGALLPLLSVISFWVVPSANLRVDYSLLLLGVGLLYGTLAVMRKSFGFGVLAVVASNGGMWYFLHRMEGYHLLDHPQLWLIPPALCVLVAAQLCRRQLSDYQLVAIRYAASTLVYVSSTADIFLNGVAEQPWLPLILAGLSVAGIFTGILLRVRAFLFLGTGFLLLAILTIIWHAAVNLEQTWLWYASGIVAGAVIIAVFAVFEKKRDQVLRMVEELKRWQQ